MRTAGRGRLSRALRATRTELDGEDGLPLAARTSAAPSHVSVPPKVSISVGVDLVDVDEVLAAIDAHGDRYLRRLFTPDELESCRGATGYSGERLAARYAAKEATLKVLEPGPDEVPEWQMIEVRRRPSGACELALSGTAAALAKRRGIGALAMSVSHEGHYATAVVIGWGDQG